FKLAPAGDMSVQVELLVHHGGRMQFNGRAAHYAGGEVVEVTFDADFLCYFQLIKLGTEDLQYDSVDRIWYVAPGKTLSNGLVRVLSDADAVKLCEAGKEGVVEVYLDTSAVESCYGDNEELESEWHNGLSGSDPEAEVSAVAANVGVVHLIDDSDRTTDPEFLEAMENLGVARFRRRVRHVLSDNGEEVEQLTEANRRHQPPRAREEIPVEPNVMVDLAAIAGNDATLHSASDGDDEGTCKGRGHNARKCPNKDTIPATENVPAANERPGVSTRRPRQAPSEGPIIPVQRRRKPTTCGSCGEVGHNARSCLRNRGVQGVVDPNTNRTQLNNELRTAMQGVGVYTNPTTGNMYYRVPPGGLDARVVDDVHGGSQPPATQPTQ
ncbi:hypothetical protein LINPERHAP2_LOCUS31729, partial [Linum perenne]